MRPIIYEPILLKYSLYLLVTYSTVNLLDSKKASKLSFNLLLLFLLAFAVNVVANLAQMTCHAPFFHRRLRL